MLQLKWVWKNMKGKRVFFAMGMLLSAITSAMSVVVPKLTQLVIDKVFKGGMDERLFLTLVLSMVGVKLLRSALRYLMVNCLEICSQQVLVTVERKLFSNLVSEDSEFFNRNRTGDIISRATGDLDYLRHVVAWISYTLVDSIVVLLSSIVMLTTMHLGLTLSMLILTPIIFIITWRYSKYIRPFYVTLRNKSAHINTVAQENLSGNRVVKAFSREEFEKERFAECCKDFADYNVNVAVKHQIFAQVLSVLTDLLGVILIIIGGIFVVKTNAEGLSGVMGLTLGELAAFSSMRFQLSMPLKSIGTVVNDLQRLIASADTVMEINYDQPKIIDRNDCVDTKR